MKRVIVSCAVPEYREKVVDFISTKYGYTKIAEGVQPPWDLDQIVMAKSPLDYIVESIMEPHLNAELTVDQQLKIYQGFTHHIMVAAFTAQAVDFKTWGRDAIYERAIRQLLNVFKVKQTVLIEQNWVDQQRSIGAFLSGIYLTTDVPNGKG